MLTNLTQLSLTDILSNIDKYFQQDKSKLIEVFEQHIDLDYLIFQSFVNHYYSNTSYPRHYSLSSMICTLIIKSIFSIADISLFIFFLI